MENATNNADSLPCRCRGVIEWINCLLFDNLLLILEAGINLWMATRLGSSTYPIYKLYFVWISLNFKDFFGPAALSMVYLSTPPNNSPSPRVFLSHLKGQIISKGLFGVLEFSQKTNERIRRSSKNEFICLFFGRIQGYQKSFRNHLTFGM